jgi:hypothetical protein
MLIIDVSGWAAVLMATRRLMLVVVLDFSSE